MTNKPQVTPPTANDIFATIERQREHLTGETHPAECPHGGTEGAPCLHDHCQVCGYPTEEHVGRKDCLPPAPARKVRGIYDLPVFGWAWAEDGKERGW